MSQPFIRILAATNNERGDLFARMMADLFVGLGYDLPRSNVQHSGRELDLTATHRFESRFAVAECKATAEPIGGDSINKFVGALDAESHGKATVMGYFISLAGFRQSAIEQEKQGRRTRIALLTGAEVVAELIKSRILVGLERATEIAGRFRSENNHLNLDSGIELLAHKRGWIWAIFYTQNMARSHFVLVHADGTPLAQAIVNEVVELAQDLSGLTCLNPASFEVPIKCTENEALAAYKSFLADECGFIQLDGLPMDADVGSRRIKLESLLVPTHLEMKCSDQKRVPLGEVMKRHSRLAVLGPPGGGKSTLLKRLAMAYVDPKRHRSCKDRLPVKDWVPLFFRCRELRELARASFGDLLDSLAQREPIRHLAKPFRNLIDSALLGGRALLLVDGLDEISDPGDRAAFTCTLRTVMRAYPECPLVVTSREAGFRHVAAHLAPVCTFSIISQFNDDDIRRLCIAWHREVIGTADKIRHEADQLASTIIKNDRIRELATNPLLLITLLLVKRWGGTERCLPYLVIGWRIKL